MNNGLTKKLRDARRSGVPVVGITTADQTACIQLIKSALEVGDNPDPIIRWDIVGGLAAVNNRGGQVIGQLGGLDVSRPADLFQVIAKERLEGGPLSRDTILILESAHNILDDVVVRAGVLICRDLFEISGAMLVLLGPEIKLPSDLTQAVEIFDDPLPTRSEIKDLVTKTCEAAVGKIIDRLPADDVLTRASDALVGLSAFSAKQSAAMAISKRGLDVPACWERKKSLIEQVDGLTIDRENLTFADIGGCAQIVKFGRLLAGGRRRPRMIIRIDEGDKLLAGSGGDGGPGDSSGTSQDQLGVLLTGMESNKHRGVMLVGPPGCAKTLFSQSLGGELEIPTVAVDLGAAKDKYVGGSEARIRALFKMVVAVAGSEAYWILTANEMNTLPAALRRRFTHGVWYFDLPTTAEQLVIWAYHGKKNGVDVSAPALAGFDWSNWSGAEIRNCVETSYDLNCSLAEASKFIVPVAVSDPAGIEKLRNMAAGKFNSASYEGYYKKQTMADMSSSRRFGKGE